VNDRYDNLLEKMIQEYSMKIAEDLEKSIFDLLDKCVICKQPFHYTADHPFCKNNLEYLEWENERRTNHNI